MKTKCEHEAVSAWSVSRQAYYCYNCSTWIKEYPKLQEKLNLMPKLTEKLK
jgi:hypothetical protein